MWFWKVEEGNKPSCVKAAGAHFDIQDDGRLSPQPVDRHVLNHLRALPQHFEERAVPAEPVAPPTKRKK